MDESEELRAARAMRRAMLGDAYVDGMSADPDPVAVEFQDYVTSMAWGVWARGGPLSPRDRSLLVMAMTADLLTGTYSSGFSNSLMAKDVRLYRQESDDLGSSTSLGQATADVWEKFASSGPETDFTRIYPFVEGR